MPKVAQRIGCAALAALGLAVASGAHAAIESTEIASAAYTPGSGIPNLFTGAACPEGSVAVGGGTDVTDPYFLGLVRSGPTFGGFSFANLPDGIGAAPDGWNGLATLSQILPTPRVRIGAICATGIAAQTVIATRDIAIGATETVTASCPEGSSALSAGFLGSGAAPGGVLGFEPTFEGATLATLAEGAGPAPIGWTVTTRNDGFFPGTLKLAVICATGLGVSTVVSTTAVAANDLAGLPVACAAGDVATGGGHATPEGATLAVIGHGPTIAGTALSMRADGSDAPPDGWRTVLRNDALGPAVIAPIAAVCVPEPGAETASLAAVAALAHAAVSRARARPSRRRRA